MGGKRGELSNCLGGGEGNWGFLKRLPPLGKVAVIGKDEDGMWERKNKEIRRHLKGGGQIRRSGKKSSQRKQKRQWGRCKGPRKG